MNEQDIKALNWNRWVHFKEGRHQWHGAFSHETLAAIPTEEERG